MNDLHLAIGLGALVTLAMRTLPVLLLSRGQPPKLLQDWLGFVPGAIMAALIAAELIAHPAITPGGISLSLLAAIVSAVVGVISRSLFLTVVAGVGAWLGFQALLG